MYIRMIQWASRIIKVIYNVIWQIFSNLRAMYQTHIVYLLSIRHRSKNQLSANILRFQINRKNIIEMFHFISFMLEKKKCFSIFAYSYLTEYVNDAHTQLILFSVSVYLFSYYYVQF